MRAVGPRGRGRAQGDPATMSSQTETPSIPAATDAEAAARRGRPRTPVAEVPLGARFTGKVVGLSKFGAFVDIGAMTDGLVHVTELPGKRVQNVEEVLKSGQEVEVWVKEVDAAKNRISLTMRTRPNHPLETLAVGQVLSGKVTSVAAYGAFVDIDSDTEGLVHVSEMSSGFVQKPFDVVKPGDAVEVRIKEVDAGRRRVSLSMVGLATDPGKEEAEARAVEQAEAAARRQVERAARAADQAETATAGQPEERMPTAMELAMRRAMGQDDGAADRGGRGSKKGKTAKPGLSDLYSRMLAEYRETKEGA